MQRKETSLRPLLEQLRIAKRGLTEAWAISVPTPTPSTTGAGTALPDAPYTPAPTSLQTRPDMRPQRELWDRKGQIRAEADYLATLAHKFAASIGNTQIAPGYDVDVAVLTNAAEFMAQLDSLLTAAGHSEFSSECEELSTALSKHAQSPNEHPDQDEIEGEGGEDDDMAGEEYAY